MNLGSKGMSGRELAKRIRVSSSNSPFSSRRDDRPGLFPSLEPAPHNPHTLKAHSLGQRRNAHRSSSPYSRAWLQLIKNILEGQWLAAAHISEQRFPRPKLLDARKSAALKICARPPLQWAAARSGEWSGVEWRESGVHTCGVGMA